MPRGILQKMGQDDKPPAVIGWTAAGIVVLFLIGAGVNVINSIGPIHSPHRNAWMSLRDLARAEADFRTHDRDGNGIEDFWAGDVSQLYLMTSGERQLKLIESSLAYADRNPVSALSGSMEKSGYWFTAIKTDEMGSPYDQKAGRNREKFGFCAYPAKYSADGRFTFIVNELNVIWKKDQGGAPVLQWPKDPLAEGWSRIADAVEL